MHFLLSFFLAAMLFLPQQPSPNNASTTGEQTASQTPAQSTAPTSSPAIQQAPSNAQSTAKPGTPAATGSSAPAPQRSSAPTPLVKVTTRLVLVDVVVTDNAGRPALDLKQGDFEVRENGKPQKIVGFAFQPPPDVSKSNYKPFTLSPGVFTNLRNLNGQIGPPTILLVDALNTPFKDQAYLRQQLVKYLAHLEPGRNIAIYTLGTRLRMIQDFTSDPDVLHEAMKKVTGQSSMFNGEQQDIQDEFPGLDPDSSDQGIAQAAQQLQQFENEQQAYQRDIQVRITLDAMK